VTHRAHNLLQTTVVLLALLTPAWLLPAWVGLPWAVAVALLAGPMLWLTWHHAPWVPTPAEETAAIVEALQLGPTSTFVDLGAGDGRLLQRLHAASGARCVGVEAAPLVYLLGRLRLAWAGSPCRLVWGDLRRFDLSDADAVYLWGTAYGLDQAWVDRLRSLRPGARVVSYGTPLPGWDPTSVLDHGLRSLYIYEVESP